MAYGSQRAIRAAFTRPADTTAYAANDSVSDSTTAPTAVTITDLRRTDGGGGFITGATVLTNKASITPTLRLHIYSGDSAPTAINDNAAFTQPTFANAASYIGFIDVGPLATNGATGTSYGQTHGLQVGLSGAGEVYVLVQTLDAFTPDSAQQFSIRLHADTD